MTNIITACFGGTRYANTRPAWLIDHGMVLKLSGVELPEVYEVDFSNSKTSAAKRVLGNADGVVIPDEYFLSKAQQIYAWVYLTTGDSGYTVLQVTIPLAQRPDVTDEPPTPQETDLIEQAIAALNTGVTRAETAADNADQSADNAADAETNAAESARLAKLSEDNAALSENNAKESETNAAASERNADQAEQNAAESARRAKASADAADESRQGAQTAAEDAESAADEAKEAADNAERIERELPDTIADALREAKESGEFDGKDGANGVTYTPTVDAEGNISWVNDGGLPNPQPRNIKGTAGKDGEDGEVGATPNLTIGTVETLEPGEDATAEITGTAENPVLNLGIPQGEQGEGADTSNLAPVIINSASGDIASFADGADGLPVKQLTVNIEPIQAGSGDPSPDNVRPISGRTSANVTRTGKNLCGTEQLLESTYWGTSYAVLVDLINLLPVGTYTLSHKATVLSLPDSGSVMHGPFYITAMVNGSQVPVNSYRPTTDNAPTVGKVYEDSTTFSITEANKGKCNRVYAYCDSSVHTEEVRGNYQIYNIQLELGSTASAYEPYQGNTYTIQLGDTVYGGTLDVLTGKMLVDRMFAKFNGAENWLKSTTANNGFFTYILRDNVPSAEKMLAYGKLVSNAFKFTPYADTYFHNYGYIYSDSSVGISIDPAIAGSTIESFKSWLNTNNVQVVYELATPIEITLTPTQIETLLGTNNIWADAGPADVDYRADTKLYVDNIHQPTEDDMTADAQIASGKYFLIGGTLYLSTTVIPAGDTIIPGTNCIKTNLAEALNALNA